ncbi:Uncharacterised protein [Candidatus Gugararchaeum adminiculabundum]|nr:Uncharacterised protein [Candidatus Gugararchaeum adminiculabundum]
MQITIDEVEQYIISRNSGYAKNGNATKLCEADKKFADSNFTVFLPLKKSLNELTKSLTLEAKKIAPANSDEKKMQEEVMKCIQSELKNRSSKIYKIFQDREAQKKFACGLAHNYALLSVSANSLRQKKSISGDDFKKLLDIFQNREGSCSFALPPGDETRAFLIALKSSEINSISVSFSDPEFSESMKSLGESMDRLNRIEKNVVPELQKVSMQLTNNPDLTKEERGKLQNQRNGLELDVALLNDLRELRKSAAISFVIGDDSPAASVSEIPVQSAAPVILAPSIPVPSESSAPAPADTALLASASTPAQVEAEIPIPTQIQAQPAPIEIPAKAPETIVDLLPAPEPAISVPEISALPQIFSTPLQAPPAQLHESKDFTPILQGIKAEHAKSLDADLSLLYRGLAELDSIKSASNDSAHEALLWRDKLKYEFKSMPAPTASEAKVLGKISDWRFSQEGKRFASGGSVPTIMRLICFRKDSKKVESRIVLSTDSSHPFRIYEGSQESMQKSSSGIFDITSYESSFNFAVLATQVYDEDSKLFLHPALYSREAAEPKRAANLNELENSLKSFASTANQKRLAIELVSSLENPADPLLAVSIHRLLKNSGADFAFTLAMQDEAQWRAFASSSGKIIDLTQKHAGRVPETARHLGYSYAFASEETEIAEEIEGMQETAALACD